MKKFIIIVIILFIANLGCKKINQDNGGLCACSPISYPYLSLVIKDLNNNDLLNTVNSGSFTKNQIQLFSKDVNGIIKQVNFVIRPPFSYGNQQFNFSQIFSEEIALLARTASNLLYLKLGNNELQELKLIIGASKVEKLFIGNKEIPMDNGDVSSYNTIFYLSL